jgi:transposase
MISAEREAEILRLFHAEKWRIGTIAAQLGIHHCTVERVLRQAGVATAQTLRPSIADPYVPFMIATLEKYPRLCASRLFEMVKQRGYPGGPDHFRAIVSRYRPRPPAEAFLRLRTLPGEVGQCDWGYFGKIRVGRALRRLLGFVLVAAWSRKIFLRFYFGDAMPNFLRGHVAAFTAWGFCPREIWYDNLKSAVIERVGDAIRFNETILALASYYHFKPHPVAPYRGNEKGRVERAVRYIRNSFFAAREFTDLDDLNAQADRWTEGLSADRRCPGERHLTVREAFVIDRQAMLVLPDNPFPTEERVEVSVGKTPYVRFDLNDYSVPHTLVRRTLVVAATLDQVRILDGSQIVATHPRSFDRDQQIEEPAHIAALVERKQHARQERGRDRLRYAVPSSQQMLIAIAERGGNLGSTTNRLLGLLDANGAEALERAVQEAVASGTPHLAAVHQGLERQRRERGQVPPIAVTLPDNPRVRDLVVKPHALAPYDALAPRTGAVTNSDPAPASDQAAPAPDAAAQQPQGDHHAH